MRLLARSLALIWCCAVMAVTARRGGTTQTAEMSLRQTYRASACAASVLSAIIVNAEEL